MKNKKTFTTAQGISAAVKECVRHLNKGEDIRKVYPAEGTGCGGRWVDLLVCCEIDNAETGEHIRDVYFNAYYKHDPKTQARKMSAELWN